MALFVGIIDNGMMNYGIYTILKEVLDNSVDEFTTGFGKNIIVDVDEKTATVRDFDQGIPLGAVIKAVSTLNTSGRFDDSVYQKAIGLNGVGLADGLDGHRYNWIIVASDADDDGHVLSKVSH